VCYVIKYFLRELNKSLVCLGSTHFIYLHCQHTEKGLVPHASQSVAFLLLHLWTSYLPNKWLVRLHLYLMLNYQHSSYLRWLSFQHYFVFGWPCLVNLSRIMVWQLMVHHPNGAVCFEAPSETLYIYKYIQHKNCSAIIHTVIMYMITSDINLLL